MRSRSVAVPARPRSRTPSRRRRSAVSVAGGDVAVILLRPGGVVRFVGPRLAGSRSAGSATKSGGEWDSSAFALRASARSHRVSDPPRRRSRRRVTRAEADGGESGIRTHGRVSPTHAFQACSFNHSDISPCRINNLRPRLDQDYGDCDKSSNVPRSLMGFSSIAAPLMLARRNERGALDPIRWTL